MAHPGVVYQAGPDLGSAVGYLPLEELRVTIFIIDGEHLLTLSFILVLIHAQLLLGSH